VGGNPPDGGVHRRVTAFPTIIAARSDIGGRSRGGTIVSVTSTGALGEPPLTARYVKLSVPENALFGV
jgi:hypothetical protein